MSEYFLHETFARTSMDPRLSWLYEPHTWRITGSRLRIEPPAKTDYWQTTHYGFQADNGPFLYAAVEGDFVIATRVSFYPAKQYDQAGLLVRISPSCWLKASIEYEPDEAPLLGAVVTNHGYSDWSTQAYPSDLSELELRIRREGSDYIVDYLPVEARLADQAGEGWQQIRMAHLLEDDGLRPVLCGLYACSPIESGLAAEFHYLTIWGGKLGGGI